MIKTEVITKLKSNKGITLIALVITIIVLLILAGVAISMLSGDNGILKKAAEAKEKTEEAQKKEETILKDTELLTDFATKKTGLKVNNGFVTGIERGTTVGDILAKLGDNYNILDSAGNVIRDTTKTLGTGMKLIKEDSKVDAQIIIFGDLTGSIGGEINHDDVFQLLTFIANNTQTYEDYKDNYRVVAMDINHDKVVDYVDRDLLTQASLNIYTIDQNVEAVPVDELTIRDVATIQRKWLADLQNKIKGTQYSIEQENRYFLFKGVVEGQTVGDLMGTDEKPAYLPANSVITRDGKVLGLEEELEYDDNIGYIWGNDTEYLDYAWVVF